MDIPLSLPFSKSFDLASGNIAERFQNPWWKLKEMIFGARHRKAIEEVKKFGNVLVSYAIHRRSMRGVSARQLQTNLIDSLLDHIEDRQIVADAAMNYLSAGQFHSSTLLDRRS